MRVCKYLNQRVRRMDEQNGESKTKQKKKT